jgi:hypothetical protein
VPAAFWECCPIACACHAKQNPGPPKVQNLFHLPRETYIAEKREFARPEWREARSSRCELSINPGPYTYSKSPAVDSMFEEKLAKSIQKCARATLRSCKAYMQYSSYKKLVLHPPFKTCSLSPRALIGNHMLHHQKTCKRCAMLGPS